MLYPEDERTRTEFEAKNEIQEELRGKQPDDKAIVDIARLLALLHSCSIEEINKLAVEKHKLCGSIAQTLEGILAHLQYLRAAADRDILSSESKIFDSIEAGLNNLQQKVIAAPVAMPHADPVVALWDKLQDIEGQAVEAPIGEVHDALAVEGIKIEDKFLETIADSPKGLMLQIKHLVRFTEEVNASAEKRKRLKVIEVGLKKLGGR